MPRRLSPAAQPGPHTGRRPANAGKTFPVEVLTAQEVNALMRACSARTSSGLRNRALIAVLYRSGLRLAEALALEPKDVERKRCDAKAVVRRRRQPYVWDKESLGYAHRH
jgi:site-specific recombinase XerD